MNAESGKTLAVAVDFNDNIAGHEPSPKRMYTPAEVEQMLDYFRALGVRRLYWFHNDHNGLYEFPFGAAANLLAFAVQHAHQRGMTILAVVKPFETGTVHTIPAHLQPPTRHTRTVQGSHVFASAFASKHPEMRLRFRPRLQQRPGRRGVTGIDLVNQGDQGASLRHDELELCWSPLNRAAVEQRLHPAIESELQRVATSDLYDGFILYEAAGIMGFDEQGRWHSCTPLEQAIKRWWPTSECPGPK